MTDDLMQTRLDVAEMKGMLSQVLLTYAERLTGVDERLNGHEARLDAKGKEIATHTVQITGITRDIEQLKNDNNARLGRILGTVGAIVAVVSLGLAVINRVTLGI